MPDRSATERTAPLVELFGLIEGASPELIHRAADCVRSESGRNVMAAIEAQATETRGDTRALGPSA